MNKTARRWEAVGVTLRGILLRWRAACLGLVLLAACLSAAAAQDGKPAAALVFDVVRVGADNYAVMAGRGPAGARIRVHDRGQLIASSKSDRRGEWVLITEQPLAVGSSELRLSARFGDGREVQALEVLVILVPDRSKEGGGGGEDAFALLLSKRPGAMSKLLQRPSRQRGLQQLELSLDKIDYDETGTIALAGSGPKGATVRLYLDNAHIGDVRVDENLSWSHAPKQRAGPGRHRLRVDQIDAKGNVAARIEVAFEREAEAAREETKTAAASATDESAEGPMTVTIQKGQTLWRIARKVYGHGARYTLIYQANTEQIRDPDKIYPGQVFELPRKTE